MIATALDNFTAPPSSKLLGWHLLDARPKDGWIRIGFDGKRDFCNPAGFVQGGILSAMPNGPWVMGEQYTVCDPYLFTIGLWLEGDGVDLAALPKVAAHRKRMSERPAVQMVLADEKA